MPGSMASGDSAFSLHPCRGTRVIIAALNVSTPRLNSNYAEQDRQFAKAWLVLEDAIAAKAFPAASVAITHHGRLIALRGFGHFTYEPDSNMVAAETIFDIASVSKVVATTAMAMILHECGILDLDARVADLWPDFATGDPRRRQVTIRMLLAHSSGLPAYEKLFLRTNNRDELIQMAATTDLTAAPSSRAEYSDIGFIVLGEILAKLAAGPLDSFCTRKVFEPLGMQTARYLPPREWEPKIPPTIDDQSFRHKIVRGEVHDENCWVMGGVSGHAGVFATALDVARFAECMLRGGAPLFAAETVSLFTRRDTSTPRTSRALGWDTPSQPSSSGRYFSPYSFGHLGYTGTSLWCDPERQLSVTLLTNRVWPDCSNQAIKQVRPRFHDAVVEALETN